MTLIGYDFVEDVFKINSNYKCLSEADYTQVNSLLLLAMEMWGNKYKKVIIEDSIINFDDIYNEHAGLIHQLIKQFPTTQFTIKTDKNLEDYKFDQYPNYSEQGENEDQEAYYS
jgi:hypothetical protein